MDSMTTIEELLKQLPVEKTGVDFTAKVMAQIAALPAQRRPGVWAIVGICLGGLAVLGSGWWAADYFFEWNTLYVQPFLQHAGRAFSSTFNPLFRANYSPTVISGMMMGVVLLLADAAVRKHIRKHRNI